ncbi:hypothetical protein [Streptomyces sp. NBC_00989]|uniref:hypothetical protein n=1 Tax=Streptomyces sp. NBC_00989 TaxID=2903705 RepID=UPI002F9194F2|nr:hypothetical protein OG714_54385 [Streptomyces sp. NBC_00989]
MTKSHGRKSRARKTSRSRGATYAAANAGTLHQHDSGPSNTDLQPADPSGWGVEATPDMRTASALIGACIERCAVCQQALAVKLLDEDPIVLTVTAGSVYTLHAATEPDAGSLASAPSQRFFRLVQQARAHGGDGRMMLTGVEMMNRADRAELLEDALDLWTFYGHKHPGLMRSQDTGPKNTSPFTFTFPDSEPGQADPGTVLDLSGLAHPAEYGVRADMTLTESGRIASLGLFPHPETSEAGYDDLRERLAWEPYVAEGLPEKDPAWVLKVDGTRGALLGIVRLLDATLLPDRPRREWRTDAYDVILWTAPELTTVSAEWLETARRRGSALLYGPLDLSGATPPDPSRLVAVHAHCEFADRL